MLTPEAAIVNGRNAHVIARMLRWAAPRDPGYAQLPLHLRTELENVISELETVGARWLSDATTVDIAARLSRSQQPNMIGTADAAQLLGLRESWVRERARDGDWDAVKHRNRWCVDRAAVLAEADERRRRSS